MKVCSMCGIEQEDGQFAKWRLQCRLCRNQLQRAKNKRYSKTRKGKIVKQKEYRKGRQIGWDKHYLKYRGRWRHLEARYGVTENDYKQMLVSQKGFCAICGNPETATRKSANGTVRPLQLSVDHNHNTGVVRELLCSKCNLALSYFKENVEYMANAISYIEKHKTAEALMGVG